MKSHVLILSFSTPNGIVENFVNQIAYSFCIHGFFVNQIQVDGDLRSQWQNIDHSKIKLILSIGPLPLALQIDGKPVYEFFACPIIMYCIDNVIYDFARNPISSKIISLAEKSSRFKVAFASSDYIENLQLTNKLQGYVSKPIFLPMAGFFNHETTKKPIRQKKLCVIGSPFALNVDGVTTEVDMLKTAQKNNYLSLSKAELADIVQSCNAPDFRGNVVQVILKRLRLHEIDLLDSKLLKFAASIDTYVRVNTRISAVRSLSRFPIDIYGPGWESHFHQSTNIQFKGSIPHDAIPIIARRYAAVINFDPNFENGVHDRVLTTLGVGTKVITNENYFLNKIPSHETAIKTYKIYKPELNLLAEEIFDENCEYDDRKCLFEQHCWPSRIRDLLEEIND